MAKLRPYIIRPEDHDDIALLFSNTDKQITLLSLRDIVARLQDNNLKPYDYFNYLLTEIPRHLDDTNRAFLEYLLP